MVFNDIFKEPTFEEWLESKEEEINAELAESGADKELDFDPEKEYERRYQNYLEWLWTPEDGA